MGPNPARLSGGFLTVWRGKSTPLPVSLTANVTILNVLKVLSWMCSIAAVFLQSVLVLCAVTTTEQRSLASLVVCGRSGSPTKFMFDDSALLALLYVRGPPLVSSEHLLVNNAALEGSSSIRSSVPHGPIQHAGLGLRAAVGVRPAPRHF